MFFTEPIRRKAQRRVLGSLFVALMALAIPALALGTNQPAANNQLHSFGSGEYLDNPSAVTPGTLNYVQGAVSLGNHPVSASTAGSTILKPGELLTTGKGKVEMLLTPGVYFRMGADSTVKMVSPELTWTAVDLEKGEAIVEVDEIHPENNIQIYHGGVGTQLLKTGIYKFNAASSKVLVFQGEAAVRKPGNHWVVVKSGHEYELDAELGARPQKFDRAASEGDLYAWSSLRSKYLAQTSQEMAGNYGAYYPGWALGPAWYGWGWGGPYFGGPFWGPFGWGGFYPSPYFGGSVFFPYTGRTYPHYHYRGSSRK